MIENITKFISTRIFFKFLTQSGVRFHIFQLFSQSHPKFHFEFNYRNLTVEASSRTETFPPVH